MKPALFACIVILPAGLLFAQDRPSLPHSASALGEPRYALLNINNITAWLRSDGLSAHSPTGWEGVIYPRGTAPVVYQDGYLWAGKAYLDSTMSMPAPPHTIRVGGQTYNVGTRAGWVIGQGADASPVDPLHPATRIYRIRRDYTTMSIEELQLDAAGTFERGEDAITYDDIQQILQRYEADWIGWPVHHGAPYIERNGIPGYQPPPPFGPWFTAQNLIDGNYDEPGIAGVDPSLPADQLVFTVFNDLSVSTTQSFHGSFPLGLEAQVTLWAYKRTDALGNMYFKRLRLINKGGVDVGDGVKQALWIDSMFIGQWADTDLGHFADDLLGCDSTISLAYTYNETSSDQRFLPFGIAPPAVGWSILQGPVVPGAPSDTATVDFRTVYGKRNLGMTSYSPKWSGTSVSDPPFTYEGALRWWRWIQGYLPDPSSTPAWRLYPHPPGTPDTKFPLNGDPVTRTGWIDGLRTIYSGFPGDRRHTLSTGPFTFAPGDTQEVIIAVTGGLGADHLTSITAMRFNERAARQMQRTRFASHRPPASPSVHVAELDGEIILEWGSDLQRVRETEEHSQPGGYAFEGYTVYQLPRRDAQPAEGIVIATFDVVNGVATIVDEAFDPETGLVVPVIVQRGTDSGIQRHLRLTRNHLAGRGVSDNLFNGQEYHYAVTAYSYSSQNASPKSFESDPARVTARPRVPFGINPRNHYGDTLVVQHLSGNSTGWVRPIIIDPLAGTGDTYLVGVDTTGGIRTWYARNRTRERVVLTGETNFVDSLPHPIIEGGVELQVVSPPPGLKRSDIFSTEDTTQWGWNWLQGERLLSWANGDGLVLEGFRGAAGWESPHRLFQGGEMAVPPEQVKAVHIRFAQTDTAGTFNPADANASFAYRYGRGFNFPPARPEFVPFIINPSAGYAYQDYTRSMPFAVYDVEANPPRRLAIGFLENNATGGLVNGRYWPPSAADGVNNVAASGPREWLFIFDSPYTGATPDTSLQVDLLASVTAPVMYMATWTRRNTSGWPPENVMALYPNKPLTIADTFEYVSPVPEQNAALMKASAARAGVFPNPYYAGQTEGPFSTGTYVTFNNLPYKARIRIFNLAGHLVRSFTKESLDQFLIWDLKNENGWLIASGMYICHVEMPEIGETRILKLAVIQNIDR